MKNHNRIKRTASSILCLLATSLTFSANAPPAADTIHISGAGIPAKLLVPSDAKPSRGVRGVATITVVDTTAAPEPAK